MTLNKKLLIISVLFALLVGCSQQPATARRIHLVNIPVTVHQYHQQIRQDDGSMALLYWYVFWNPSNLSYSYYSTSTAVSDVSRIPWTSSGKALPEQVEQELANAHEVEPLASEIVEESVPDTINDQQDSMTNEGGPAPSESETSSSDSSSSSSDSGGGDGGGGGD